MKPHLYTQGNWEAGALWYRIPVEEECMGKENSTVINPDGEAITFELDRVLDSRKFSEAPRISQFLKYVVDEDLAGRGARISGNSIAIDVYRRDQNFDPRTDPVVRVEARRLRRMLTHYFLTEGKQDPLVIEIPKGGYRPKYNDNSEDDGVNSIASILDTPLPNSTVIAVLPFRSQGSDTQMQELAAGITTNLITAFSRFDVLRVISQQSSDRYRGITRDVRRIGHELGARFIITGSVQKLDCRVRVTVAISHAEDGTQLWAKKFDRDLNAINVFEFEDEIAETVISEGANAYGFISQVLSERIRDLPIERLSVQEATHLFLSYFKRRSGQQAFPLAKQAMQSVVEREPDNSPALAMLAILLGEEYLRGLSDNGALALEARKLANRAAAIKPDSVLSHLALSVSAYALNEPKIAIREAELAIKANAPGNLATLGLAACTIGLCGEWERGISLLRSLQSQLATYPCWHHEIECVDFYLRGDYPSAMAVAERFTLDQWPGKALCLALIFAEMGDFRQARGHLEQLKAIEPGFTIDPQGYIHRYFPREQDAQRILAGLELAGLDNLAA